MCVHSVLSLKKTLCASNECLKMLCASNNCLIYYYYWCVQYLYAYIVTIFIGSSNTIFFPKLGLNSLFQSSKLKLSSKLKFKNEELFLIKCWKRTLTAHGNRRSQLSHFLLTLSNNYKDLQIRNFLRSQTNQDFVIT